MRVRDYDDGAKAEGGWLEPGETLMLPERKAMGFASLYYQMPPRHTVASSRRISPELCFIVSPTTERGRREDREPAGTRGPLCEILRNKKLHSGIQV